VTGGGVEPPTVRVGLCGAVALGALLRILAAGFSGGIASDGVTYVRMAREFLETGFRSGCHPMIPPGYPMAVAATGAVVGNLELAGQIVSILAGLATIPVVFLIARAICGRLAALAATWLYAFAPLAVRYAAKVQTESLYTFVLALGILAALRLLAEARPYRYFILGGVSGIAYMIRPEGMGLLVLAAVWLVPLAGRSGPRALLRTGAGLALAGVAFAALGVWQVLYFHDVTGRWTPSAKLEYFYRMDVAGNSQEFLYSLTPDRTMTRYEAEAATARRYDPLDLKAETVAHPARFFGHWARNMLKFVVLWPEAFGYALVPLLLAGVFLRRAEKRRRLEELFAASAILFFVAAISLTFAERRLLAPLVPLACVWAGVGVCELSNLVARARPSKRKHPARTPIVVVIVTLALTLPWMILRPVKRGIKWGTGPERVVGSWVKGRFGLGMNVMAIKPKVPFYAEGEHVPLPLAPYEDMIAFSRFRGVDVMVLGLREAAKRRPGLVAEISPQDFALAARIGEGGETFLVYRFVK